MYTTSYSGNWETAEEEKCYNNFTKRNEALKEIKRGGASAGKSRSEPPRIYDQRRESRLEVEATETNVLDKR